MAIDLTVEDVFPLALVGEKVPIRRRGGKPLHPTTAFRWAKLGARAGDGARVFLETIRVGGSMCTSLQAVQRFCDRLTGTPVDPPTATPASRRRAIERAERELAEAGI
jgi:hypothetical protein